jgi:hypothetical protein
MSHFRLASLAILLALSLWAGVTPARAVVIALGDRNSNAAAPFPEPGWQNVTGRGEGTAVYLGDRWMITASHVGAGSVDLNGKTFSVRPGSVQRLNNPIGLGLSAQTDLVMFQLTEDPGLAGLNIITDSPPFDSRVIMMGRGANRATAMTGWQVDPITSSFFRWSEVPQPFATALGYRLTADRSIRWGTNTIGFDFEVDNDNDVVVSGTNGSGDVLALTTTFNFGELMDEAQAVEGDSGGGVFTQTISGWELVGVMTSTKLINNQPANTVVFGDQTYITDFSRYRDQILAVLNSSPQQNALRPGDVNGDGTVAAVDALQIINDLNANGVRTLVDDPKAPIVAPFLDVNGDHLVSPADVLAVINRIPPSTQSSLAATGLANGAGGIAGTPVPEPATWLLAIAGLVGLLAAYRQKLTKAFK